MRFENVTREGTKLLKQDYLNTIEKAFGEYRARRYNDKSMEELKALYEKAVKELDRKDYIHSIVLSKEDLEIDDYLIEDYDVIQDANFLKCEEQIEDYFKDCGRDFLDCGQGYYMETAKVIIKIAQKYYSVNIFAEIVSSKQDVGDRLYWVDDITRVEYKEIEKPCKKERVKVTYDFDLTVDEAKHLDSLLRSYNYI